jgi:8-oxo-dGTP pyrophosphatase MutT (NUDIX family)
MSWNLRRGADRVVRVLAQRVQRIRKRLRAARGATTLGAHAIALTREGRIILVMLRYAPGWRLPGGGRAADEDPVEAALRELREEIGMVSHTGAQLAAQVERRKTRRLDLESIVIVRDVIYRPRKWSWEVERVCEAPLDALPANLAPVTRRWLAAAEELL